MSDARRFTELTAKEGDYWHEMYGCNGQLVCSCGEKFSLSSFAINHVRQSNPTYTNAADILNRMKEFCGEERYRHFIVETGIGTWHEVDSFKEGRKITFYIKEEFIRNPSDLLQKAIEWLEAEDEKA